MPQYVFSCLGPDHKGNREFTVFVHHVPAKVVNRHPCPQPGCGSQGKRDLAKEIPSQSVVGVTAISHSTTVKGSIAQEIEFVAGRFKKNPDGSVDPNHRPVRDSGELEKWLNGANDLGDPVIDDNGRVMRRKDGSVIRRGAKLGKGYARNSNPSGIVRKGPAPKTAEWIDYGSVEKSNPMGTYVPPKSHRYVSPRRAAR